MAAKKEQSVSTAFTNTAQRISNAMAQQVEKFEKLVADAKALPDTVTPLSEKIEDAEIRLKALSGEYETKLRESAAELALKVKENKESVLNSLLSEFGLAKVSKTDLNEIKDNLEKAVSDREDAVASAVSDANRSNSIALNAVKSKAESDMKLALAEAKAQITSLTEKVAFYEQKAQEDKAERAAEREARIATEEARSKTQGANIYTNSK